MSKSADAGIAALRKRNPQLGIVDQTNARPPIALTATEAAALGMTGAGVEAGLSAAPLEHDEQKALFEWADAMQGEHPELAMLFAIPNGGARHPAVAAQLKAEGVKAGVPDVCLPVARGRFHSLWIEMKRKPNKPTQAQREWIESLRQHGHFAIVCWSKAEAQVAIMAYLTQEG